MHHDRLWNPVRFVWPGALALAAACVLALAPFWAAAQEDEAVLASEHPELGLILTTSTGMTLYTFAEDSAGVSACVGPCLELWPAYTVESEAALFVDVALGLSLGVLERPDTGELQVTIDGQPVYLYAVDQAPGDALGHGLQDAWFVIEAEATTEVDTEGEFSVDPTPAGLTITSFTGALAALEADGPALGLISAFATVDGEFVGYVFGAPAFVNAEFNAQFAAGMQDTGLIVRAN